MLKHGVCFYIVLLCSKCFKTQTILQNNLTFINTGVLNFLSIFKLPYMLLCCLKSWRYRLPAIHHMQCTFLLFKRERRKQWANSGRVWPCTLHRKLELCLRPPGTFWMESKTQRVSSHGNRYFVQLIYFHQSVFLPKIRFMLGTIQKTW
jgi:hypothetical protein